MKCWVQECETEGKFGIVWTSQDEIESITKELTRYAIHQAENMLQDWNENEFKPAIEKKVDEFIQKANACIKNFQKYINDAEKSFSGSDDPDAVNTIARFLKSNGMDADLLGDTLKLGIAGGIGAGLAVILGSVVAWWILWPALLASGGLLAAFNRDSKMEKLKEKVGEELETALAKKTVDCNSELEDIPFITDLQERVQMIDDTIKRKIRDIGERAAQAEANCKKEKNAIDARKSQLDNLEKQAEELSKNISLFMTEINA